jgi:hypothetical protein
MRDQAVAKNDERFRDRRTGGSLSGMEPNINAAVTEMSSARSLKQRPAATAS